MEHMAALPGFGPWTVQYLAMRALGWPDAFPHTDYGVRKALGNLPPRDILALAKGWSPWRCLCHPLFVESPRLKNARP